MVDPKQKYDVDEAPELDDDVLDESEEDDQDKYEELDFDAPYSDKNMYSLEDTGFYDD